MPGFGLDYNVLKEVKPDIIMVSVPGFGSTGRIKIIFLMPRRCSQSADWRLRLVIPAGNLQLRPSLWLTLWGECMGCWQFAALFIITTKRAKGQHVELAQSEAIMSLLPEVVMEYEMTGRIRPRMGNRDEIMAPHGCYPCNGKDKWVAIAVANDEEWQALCRVMGNPEWLRMKSSLTNSAAGKIRMN